MSSRAALVAYIEKLNSTEIPWYYRASRTHYFFWNALVFVPLVTGVASAIIAGMIDQSYFQTYGRVWLIALPLLGGFASTLLSRFRFDEMEDVRERGLLELTTLCEKARIDEAGCIEDDGCKPIHEDLLKSVDTLELRQHTESRAILKAPLKQRE